MVDTDVFSLAVLADESHDPRVSDWLDVLTGLRLMISFQTSAEVLAGGFERRWSETRLTKARRALQATPTISCEADVIDAYAVLTAACRHGGHPLHQSAHVADRWVAASAIAKGLPLLSGDQIYAGAPGLTLLA